MTALNGSVLARLNIEADDAPDPDVVARLGPPDRSGRWRNTRGVLTTILSHDPRWSGRLKFNEFLGEPILDDAKVTDHDLRRIGLQVDRAYGPNPTVSQVYEAVDLVSRERPFHPVRQYLRSLKWDGVPRVDRIAPEVLGSEDTELNRTMCRKFLVSAVARAMKPGCKADAMLVLVGAQGAHKSMVCAALVPEPTWFADTKLNLGDKDGYLALQGKWIYEIGEMESFKGRKNSVVKAFLSTQVDRYRTPYGKLCEDHPRQLVFIGTTNNPEVISDPTGARRYWILDLGTLDLERLVRDRDQLWAEALHYYDTGEQWWLPDDLERVRAESEEDFRQTDPHREKLDIWLSSRTEPFTTEQAILLGLQMTLDRVDRALQLRIGTLLRELGWTKHRQRDTGARKHLWYPQKRAPAG